MAGACFRLCVCLKIDTRRTHRVPYPSLSRPLLLYPGVFASPVAAMVERSGMSERSFKRRFESATGLAPLAYVHALRLEEAKQMLETTNASIESIAREVGYEDPGFFSRLFKREVDLAPAEYRRRFASLRRTLDAATPTRAGRARRSSRR